MSKVKVIDRNTLTKMRDKPRTSSAGKDSAAAESGL
jgi:hypothetical protein